MHIIYGKYGDARLPGQNHDILQAEQSVGFINAQG